MAKKACSFYWLRRWGLAVALMLTTVSSWAESGALADRVVARFSAPEIGGGASPRFIFERELSFLSRLEAYGDTDFNPSAVEPYREEHVRAAMERHIAETVLESLPVSPPPTPKEIRARATAAQVGLAQRVGGAAAIQAAARAEGFQATEVFRVLQRRARASIYLDRMVAPMLKPSEAELRAIHRSSKTPFYRLAYEKVREPLRHWVVSRRLNDALGTYYEAARGRIRLTVIK